MENLLYVVVILLCVILVVLLAVVVFFLVRFIKIKENALQDKDASNESILKHENTKTMPNEVHAEVMAAKTQLESNVSSGFCVDHPELPAKGVCSISDNAYCDLCITREKDIRIARKYLSLFLDNEWLDTFMLNNSSAGADNLNELMRVKKELWRGENIPVITQKQYKINIESDEIEIYTLVMARENDQELIKERLSFLDKA